jgi:hypothetical protein
MWSATTSESPGSSNRIAPAPAASTNKTHETYHTTETSTLRAEVKAGDNPPFNFDLGQ